MSLEPPGTLTGPREAVTRTSVRTRGRRQKSRRRLLVVFRGAGLDDDGQIAFASRFGPLTTAHPTVPSVEGQPNILPVDGEEGIRSNAWHTDARHPADPPDVRHPPGEHPARRVEPRRPRRLRQPHHPALRPDDYGDQPRRLHRVTVAGNAAAGVGGKESYVIEGDDAGHYTPAGVRVVLHHVPILAAPHTGFEALSTTADHETDGIPAGGPSGRPYAGG